MDWCTLSNILQSYCYIRVQPEPNVIDAILSATQECNHFEPSGACLLLYSAGWLCCILPEGFVDFILSQLAQWKVNSTPLEPEDLSNALWGLATLSYPVSRMLPLWCSCSAPQLLSADWTVAQLRNLLKSFLTSMMYAPPDVANKLEKIVTSCGLLPKMRAVGLETPVVTLQTRKDVSIGLARFGMKHSVHHSVNIAPGALIIIDIKLAGQAEMSKLLASHNRQLVGLAHALYTSNSCNVAIQIDDGNQFDSITGEAFGNIKNRDLLLSQQGWCVLSITTSEWKAVNQVAGGVEKYLESKLLRKLMRLPNCSTCEPFKISCVDCVHAVKSGLATIYTAGI